MKNKYSIFLSVSLIIGLSTFTFVYLIASLWQKDGFSLMQTSLLAILSGVIFFIFIIVGNFLFTKKLIKKSSIKFKKLYVVSFVLVISFLTLVLTDSIVFFIDNSIPLDYAKGIEQFAIESGDNIEEIDGFSKLPFSIQNSIATFIFGFFASLISLPFIKTKIE